MCWDVLNILNGRHSRKDTKGSKMRIILLGTPSHNAVKLHLKNLKDSSSLNNAVFFMPFQENLIEVFNVDLYSNKSFLAVECWKFEADNNSSVQNVIHQIIEEPRIFKVSE
eukprot:Gregarina_sp_Poly_1__1827@NODE_1474_length_4049_cov_337_714716_g977_i0_p3_GENE_NODE_1474_length_4049_cov_337_714716_g977_i0NODE_1474_length_4049_cov_337_714716_g977_i0_p3_ORF_typecomplete_len111_score9_50_NODE_1474_length_4049_cov_337_714716_g977_i017522084